MDGKMLNSHGVDFLDGPLGLDLDEKDLDEEETRRDMAKILKELKQKHPDKEVSDDVKSKKGFVISCEETINRDLKKKYIQPIRLGNITITISAVLHSCSNWCFVGLTYLCLGCDHKPSLKMVRRIRKQEKLGENTT